MMEDEAYEDEIGKISALMAKRGSAPRLGLKIFQDTVCPSKFNLSYTKFILIHNKVVINFEYSRID